MKKASVLNEESKCTSHEREGERKEDDEWNPFNIMGSLEPQKG